MKTELKTLRYMKLSQSSNHASKLRSKLSCLIIDLKFSKFMFSKRPFTSRGCFYFKKTIDIRIIKWYYHTIFLNQRASNYMKKDLRRKAKVLAFDLEVSPNLGWFYGQYEVNPVKIENPPILLSVSWKWLGDKGRPKCLTINDCATVDPYDDSLLVRELWKMIDEAEIIVAHNLAFDEKMSNAFFLRHGLPAPSWYKGFCTLKTARRYFKLDNNKLDYLGKLLCGNTGKTAITHADVWYDMLHGNKQEKRKASDLMKEYNIVDVELLEKIYNRLLPFANNHPNMALAIGNEDVCPRCGFHADFKIKAYRKTQAGVNAIQYQCKHCHGYVTRKLTKEEREELSFQGKLTSTFRNTNY
nr:MAG TPA: DNA polymerase B [Caudoviricetes sp.]